MGEQEPLMLPAVEERKRLPVGKNENPIMLAGPEQPKLLTAGNADEQTMMAAFESNTGQTRLNTGINTEAPEIGGWKRGQGETASTITQGGQDTLRLEGARDAEAKVFATMVEVPETDNKVMATIENEKANLQDMEVGSGTTAMDSGKIEKDKLGSLLTNQKYKVLETKSAKEANRGYDKPPVKPGTIVYVIEAENNEYVRLFY